MGSAPSVSASGTCGFGQCSSSRSTSVSRSLVRLSLVIARVRSARNGCPDLGRHEYLVAAHLRGAQAFADLAFRSHRPGRCRYDDSRASAPARPDARRFVRASSQVPNPIAGILAPLASNKLHRRNSNRSNRIMSRRSGAANKGWARSSLFGDQALAKAENTVSGAWAITARSARAGPRGMPLALLPVANGLTGTPSRAANSSCVRRARRRRSRTAGGTAACTGATKSSPVSRAPAEIPPIPQFDRSARPLSTASAAYPTRFQKRDPGRARGLSAMRVKARLTIRAGMDPGRSGYA